MSKEILENFIVAQAEFERFRSNLTELLKPTSTKAMNDILHQMPNPNGHGILIYGAKGYNALMQIAKDVVERNEDLKHKTGLRIVFETIRYVFATQIINQGKTLDMAMAEKIVAVSKKHILKTKLQSITHYLPVIFPADSVVEEFSFGPVKFLSTETFFKKKYDALEGFTKMVNARWLSEAEKKGLPTQEELSRISNSAKSFQSDLNDYYKKFPWIAQITVENYEKEQSAKVAEVCIRTSLCFLKLVLPHSYADDVHIGGDMHFIKSASYTEPEDSAPNISIKVSKDILWKQNWVGRQLLEGERGAWFATLGSLIHVFLDGKAIPLLYQRFLNAMWWYSEAMTSPMPYIKVVALSNSLEAFLSTTEKLDCAAKADKPTPGISAQIADRVALLLKPHGDNDWKAKTKAFYSARSDLVHGNVPAFDESINEQVGIGFKIVQLALLEGIGWTMYCAHKQASNLKMIHELFENDLPKLANGTLPGFEYIDG